MAGRFDSKKREDGPQRSREPEKEQEENQEVEAREPEHARLQAQLGNQGVLSMLGGTESAGASLEVESMRRREPERSHPSLGGDDDPVDDGLLTIEDLTATWNQGTRKSPDRARWADPMPEDELGPEDEAWLATVLATVTAPQTPDLATTDAVVQPSAAVVHLALTDWARGVQRWTGPAWTDGLLARVVAPPAPLLQDPHGRVLPGRCHAGAIGSLVLACGAAPVHAPVVELCLELYSRRHRVRTVRVLTQETPNQLPVATSVFLDHAGGTSGHVEPAEPTEAVARALADALAHLVEFDDALALVPELVGAEPPGDDDDDPLGLDALIAEHTGGATEPDAGLYDAAVQAAERIAAEAARARVQLAGAGVALCEVARELGAEAPIETVYEVLGALDREVGSCLQLLVEIARAAQRRSVPPTGLRNGLRRGARVLDRGRSRAIDQLVRIAAGLLPADLPELAPSPGLPEGLALPFATGTPGDAVPWLLAQPPSADRDGAIALARVATGASAEASAPALRAARAATTEPARAAALGVLLGAAHLASGALDEALALSDEQLRLGIQRHNGLLVADAALLAMEAHVARGDREAADAVRLSAGRTLAAVGARAGLSLLARWGPPPAEPDDQAGTYPQTAQPGPL